MDLLAPLDVPESRARSPKLNSHRIVDPLTDNQTTLWPAKGLYFHCTLARNAVNSAPLPFPRNFWGLETVRALRGSVATHAGIRAGKEERLALGMRPLFLLFNFLFCALFGAKEAHSSSRSTSSMPRSSTDTGHQNSTNLQDDTRTRPHAQCEHGPTAQTQNF